MARIKIELPPRFTFKTTIPIRITDVNYGGHVGNDSMLSILHEARLQYLSSLGYSEMDVDGAALIMAHVMIDFKKEIFYGDAVNIYVQAGNFTRTGFEIFYKITTQSMGQEILTLTACTGMVCFDYTTRRVKALTPVAIERLQGNT